MQRFNKNTIRHTCTDHSHLPHQHNRDSFKQFLIELFSARAGIYVKQKSDQT